MFNEIWLEVTIPLAAIISMILLRRGARDGAELAFYKGYYEETKKINATQLEGQAAQPKTTRAVAPKSKGLYMGNPIESYSKEELVDIVCGLAEKMRGESREHIRQLKIIGC
jgi:hypothetical protein